jgi:hypothetical protein
MVYHSVGISHLKDEQKRKLKHGLGRLIFQEFHSTIKNLIMQFIQGHLLRLQKKSLVTAKMLIYRSGPHICQGVLTGKNFWNVHLIG